VAVGAREGAGETATLTVSTGPADLGNGYGGNGHAKGNPALEGRTASGWFRGGQDGAARTPAAGFAGGQAGDFPAGSALASGTAAAFTEPSFAEPTYTDQTASGLPVRVPKANMPPGTGGGGAVASQSGLPTRTAGNGHAPGNGPAPAKGGKALPQRSPEQVRSRLAGFQRGTRRAEEQRDSGDQSPRAEEGTLT